MQNIAGILHILIVLFGIPVPMIGGGLWLWKKDWPRLGLFLFFSGALLAFGVYYLLTLGRA